MLEALHSKLYRHKTPDAKIFVNANLLLINHPKSYVYEEQTRNAGPCAVPGPGCGLLRVRSGKSAVRAFEKTTPAGAGGKTVRQAARLLEDRNFAMIIDHPSFTANVVSDYLQVRGDSLWLKTGFTLPHDLATHRNDAPHGVRDPMRSKGRLVKWEVKPDKKGNLLFSLEAHLHRYDPIRGNDMGTWVWRRTFVMYKNSNQVPCYEGYVGEVVSLENFRSRL